MLPLFKNQASKNGPLFKPSRLLVFDGAYGLILNHWPNFNPLKPYNLTF